MSGRDPITPEQQAAREAFLKELDALPSSPNSDLSSASLNPGDLRSLEKLKQEMGADFVGAEDWQAILGKSVSGEFAPPAELISFLGEDCKFVEGKKIYQTHMLCFIPETLDESIYSINQLAELANGLPPVGKQEKVVYEGWRLSAGASLYPGKPIEGGRYVVLPKKEIAEFLTTDNRKKTASVQEEIFNSKPDKYANRGYEIGDAGGVSAALIMRYLKAVKGGIEPEKARLFNKWMYLRCSDDFTNSSGTACRAAVGFFALGLAVDYDFDGRANDVLALAVLRNFPPPERSVGGFINNLIIGFRILGRLTGLTSDDVKT